MIITLLVVLELLLSLPITDLSISDFLLKLNDLLLLTLGQFPLILKAHFSLLFGQEIFESLLSP